MAEILGTQLVAGIVPFTTEDQYPTHFAKYGKGGLRTVETIAERDAIPEQRKEIGMIVFVKENKKAYRLMPEGWIELENQEEVLSQAKEYTDQRILKDYNHVVTNKVDIISDKNGYSTLSEYQLQCQLNGSTVRAFSLADISTKEFENTRQAIWNKTAEQTGVYAGIFCAGATSGLGALKLTLHNTETNTTDIHYLCFIEDTPNQGAFLFVTTCEWNIETRYFGNKLFAYLQIPDSFTGSITVQAVRCNIKSGGNWNAFQTDGNSYTDHCSMVDYDTKTLYTDGQKFNLELCQSLYGELINDSVFLTPFGKYNTDIIYDFGDLEIGSKISDLVVNDSILHDLSKKVSSLSDGSTSEVVLLESITYAALKAKRDAGELVTGQWYRITDYITTVANDTEARSVGHPFDLLVMATSSNTLSEEAKAIKSSRDGNGYFTDANLNAWKVWYCLDNDTTRFQWADKNGTGVIYRMVDEWQNDCPYDFKNVQFKRYKVTPTTPVPDNVEEQQLLADLGGTYIGTNAEMQGLTVEDYGDFVWVYTFSLGDRLSTPVDASLMGYVNYEQGEGYGYKGYYGDNVILPCTCHQTIDNEQQSVFCLNNIVWVTNNVRNHSLISGTRIDGECINMTLSGYGTHIKYDCQNTIMGDACFGNTIGVGCSVNTFGAYCYQNTFGDNCANNTFGYTCGNNTFGDSCGGNTLWNSCANNTFGNNCSNNTFGNDCWQNSFGNTCGSNTLWNSCLNNTFGNDCGSNSFGNTCGKNTFGNGCWQNSFGDSCSGNSFWNDCSNNTFGNGCWQNSFGNGYNNNTFGNNCRYNSFGNDCDNNTFGNSCDSNSFGNSCRHNSFGDNYSTNKFGNYCHLNKFVNDCQNNTFGNSCTNNSFGNSCRHNSFGNHCGSNTLWNSCLNNTFGNDCGSNILWNYVRTITIFDGVQYVSVTGTKSDSTYVQNAQILNGTSGSNSDNRLQITFQVNVKYCQIAGLKSDGSLRIWSPADGA